MSHEILKNMQHSRDGGQFEWVVNDHEINQVHGPESGVHDYDLLNKSVPCGLNKFFLIECNMNWRGWRVT